LSLKKKHWTMDKVQKQDSSKRITPSSEPFRIDSMCLYCIWDLTFRPTTTLDGVSDQRHAPAALYLHRKDLRYPTDRRLGGPELVWTQRLQENSFASAGDRTAVIHSVVKRQY
jgi:hypothetical protein